MINFLKEFGVMILIGIVIFIEIISAFIKKRPKTLDEFISILHDVASNHLPYLIIDSEKPAHGTEKKALVSERAYSLVKKSLGRDLSSKELEIFNSYISEQIELILSTPKKKGIIL